jgi:hypothetical protein
VGGGAEPVSKKLQREKSSRLSNHHVPFLYAQRPHIFIKLIQSIPEACFSLVLLENNWYNDAKFLEVPVEKIQEKFLSQYPSAHATPHHLNSNTQRAKHPSGEKKSPLATLQKSDRYEAWMRKTWGKTSLQ